MSRAIYLRIATACALTAALSAGCTFGTAIIGGDAARVDRSTVGLDAADALDAAFDDLPGVDVPDVTDAPRDLPDAPDGAAPECRRNTDCVDPGRAVCDVGAGRCVQCLPSPDTCPTRRFCDPASLTCQDGCRRDADCVLQTLAGDGGVVMRLCDLPRRICVACRRDGDCPAGTLCAGGLCAPSCGGGRACAVNETCCGGACVDLAANDGNCGACGALCAPPNATGRCASARCGVGACVGPFGDCDGDGSNGCETPLRTASNCGACRAACPVRPNAAPRCDNASAVCAFDCLAGWADCNGAAPDGCERDLGSSVEHCGACGRACVIARGAGRCDEGRCAIASCDANFADCNGDPRDGCEVDLRSSDAHCGACGAGCAAGTNGRSVCQMGRCVAGCTAPFSDCNGRADDGCEVDTSSTLSHCGACGASCVIANGLARCDAGRCAVAGCNPGFADCNGRADDGCEVDTSSALRDCGACGAACPAGRVCARGVCELACATSQRVCADLCVDVLTDARHCGRCGFACAAGRRCLGGACQVECANGQSACGEVCADLTADVQNCGQCGVRCAGRPGAAPVCRVGRCGVACNVGLADCDGLADNGCETNLQSSATSCGTCGFRCSPANGVGACSSAGCTLAACNAGFADCDRDPSDGCETSLRRDARNCGGCGVVCDVGTICAEGRCEVPAGSLRVDGAMVINTVAASVNAGAGALSLTLSQPTGAFVVGQRVLLHQTQGAAEQVGRHELRRITAVSGALVSVDAPLQNTYVSTGTARAQALVVPEYTSVTVTARGSLSALPWDGRVGGILALWSTGDVDVLGTVSMDGRGFRGTQHPCQAGRLYQCAVGVQGESSLGAGRAAITANGSGGGGGSSGQDCAAGGGGAYGVPGATGSRGDCNGGSFGECTSACPNLGGAGGVALPRSALSAVASFGGAGGEGGADEDGAFPGAGGNGGGWIWLRAQGSLRVGGTITSSGASGRNGNQADCGGGGCGMGGGGGGAGGAIRLDVDGAAQLGEGRVLAIGGTGGLCSCRIIDLSRAAPGGEGGLGRVAVRASGVSGSTSPAAERE
jgi:hypothetical protein